MWTVVTAFALLTVVVATDDGAYAAVLWAVATELNTTLVTEAIATLHRGAGVGTGRRITAVLGALEAVFTRGADAIFALERAAPAAVLCAALTGLTTCALAVATLRAGGRVTVRGAAATVERTADAVFACLRLTPIDAAGPSAGAAAVQGAFRAILVVLTDAVTTPAGLTGRLDIAGLKRDAVRFAALAVLVVLADAVAAVSWAHTAVEGAVVTVLCRLVTDAIAAIWAWPSAVFRAVLGVLKERAHAVTALISAGAVIEG